MKVQTLSADLRRGLRPRGFTGEIVEPGHGDYEAARRVWNGSIDRHPAAVLRCHDADDVAAAVAAAADLDLPLAVRGGGHSVGGPSTVDDGIVVDLSGMRRVTVDAAAQRALVAGGALLGDLDRATQEHGLAVPAGQVSHTGVAGLTLGGGVGYLMRAHGLTIDSLLAFGPLVYAGPLVYPIECAAEVMRASRAVMAGAPDELCIHEILLTVPVHPPFPEHLQRRPALLLAPVHVGSEEQARADLEPLRELGPAFDWCPRP